MGAASRRTRMEAPSLKDVLEDLCSRFVINCPVEEQESFERLFFQIETAHWFYEDFYREQYPQALPAFNLRNFAEQLFKQCSLLHPYRAQTGQIFEAFKSYKFRVPTCGAIILNPPMNKVLLVKGYKGSTWGFPKGKINKDEAELNCAAREVMEEIGFDISPHTEEKDFIQSMVGQQRVKLYICTAVGEDTCFAPQTRKEISEIAWFELQHLPASRDDTSHGNPNHFFMVLPFIARIKKWITQHRKQ